MSINPLIPLSFLDSDNYNPDLLGTRRFALVNNQRTLSTIRQLHNGKLKPYLIDFDTLEIGRPKFLGMNGDLQRIAVPINYNDPLGKPHRQNVNFERQSLRLVLMKHLESEDYWLKLNCPEHNPFGVILAILTETNINLTLEDIDITFMDNGIVFVDSSPRSLGWYGDVYLRLL